MTRVLLASLLGLATVFAGAAQADDRLPTVNSFGLPGLIDMPTAEAFPDGELSLTASSFGSATRGTIAFQVLPNLTATFRYSGIRDLGGVSTFFDRSFDLHWSVLRESDEGWWPGLAVGIRDIAGTGLYGGEYVVATRHFGQRDQVAVTAGMGWGRLGSRNGFTNPLGVIDSRFETRPPRDAGQGGTVEFDQFFRGDAAFFGGIEWAVNDRLRFQVEYSSDAYVREGGDGSFDASESPVNFGVTYRATDNLTVGAQYMYGTAIGVSLNYTLNPSRPRVPGTLDTAPVPVSPRPPLTPSQPSYSTDWINQPDGPAILSDNINRLFEEDGGLAFLGLDLDTRRATIRVRNDRYQYEAQALGRVLRILSVTMPGSVEVFEVVFNVNGMDVSRVRVARSDIEELEHNAFGAERIVAHAEVEDAVTVADPDLIQIGGVEPRLTWGIGPYFDASLFDPENPFLGAVGLEASARYEFGNGFVAQGRLVAPILGNLDEARIVDGVQPGGPFPVRSESALYRSEANDVVLQTLTVAHYGRPAENLYSRVTLGYLERMFAGVSTELLWQRPNSDFGLGIEVNHVWRRDFDGGLGLQDYSVTSGHVSAYFDIGEDFEAQVDAGRYLAGDWGATFRLARVFRNGWRVGAFATFTDVSFDEFGEGSFDKGIEISVPLGWFAGNSSRNVQGGQLRPVLRDGGARLEVDGRLHDIVTDYQRPRFEDTEGLLWR